MPSSFNETLPPLDEPSQELSKADETARRQHAFPLQHFERQQTRLAHQFAPIAAQRSPIAVLPKQVRGFAQDAKIPLPISRLRGVVERVMLAVGERVSHVGINWIKHGSKPLEGGQR